MKTWYELTIKPNFDKEKTKYNYLTNPPHFRI